MVVYLSVPEPEREDPNDPNSFFTHVSDVFICPSDRVGRDPATNFEPLWRTSGCSYEYLAGEMMVFSEQLTVVDPQGSTTMLYRDPKLLISPSCSTTTIGTWATKTGVPRNALYFDDWPGDAKGNDLVPVGFQRIRGNAPACLAT